VNIAEDDQKDDELMLVYYCEVLTGRINSYKSVLGSRSISERQTALAVAEVARLKQEKKRKKKTTKEKTKKKKRKVVN
jgi:uncharacterized small protein (DUF1192 family)